MENTDDMQFKIRLKELTFKLDEGHVNLKNKKKEKNNEENSYEKTEAFNCLKLLDKCVIEGVLQLIVSYSKLDLSLSRDNKRTKKNLIIWANEHWDDISPIIPKIKLLDNDGNAFYLLGNT